jgi:hypothetical protein
VRLHVCMYVLTSGVVQMRQGLLTVVVVVVAVSRKLKVESES